MSAFERTLKQHLVSYRIVSYRIVSYRNVVSPAAARRRAEVTQRTTMTSERVRSARCRVHRHPRSTKHSSGRSSSTCRRRWGRGTSLAGRSGPPPTGWVPAGPPSSRRSSAGDITRAASRPVMRNWLKYFSWIKLNFNRTHGQVFALKIQFHVASFGFLTCE